MQKHRWQEWEMQLLREMYPRVGAKGMESLLPGRTEQAIQQRVQRFGIKPDMESVRQRQSVGVMKARPAQCDVEYFTRWSPNMAYILGYIYADGSLNARCPVVSFLCHSRDEEVLLAIHKELKSGHKIVREQIITERRNNGPRTRFNLSSKRLVQTLTDLHGLRPRKTHLDLPMPFVPDELLGHFFRGYFDGDGHVGFRKDCKSGVVTVCGTEAFVRQLHAAMCKLIGLSLTKVCNQRGMFSASWYNHGDIVAIKELIYPAGEYIFLSRKRKLMEAIAGQNMERKMSQRLVACKREVIS